MADNRCPQCGAPNAATSNECKYCGEALTPTATAEQYQQPAPQAQAVYQQPEQPQPTVNNNYYAESSVESGINPAWPMKSKTTAGILAIFLGGFGIHKFYMGKVGMGILYLVFCWTYIPAIIGFIEGIIYLSSNEHNFQVKHKVRLR